MYDDREGMLMDKILVTFEVPSVALRFDAWVPEFITTEDLRPLLYTILKELTSDTYVCSGEEVLCRKDDKRLLPLGVALKDMRVENGDHLLIF